MVGAINNALDIALKTNKNSVLLGEDVSFGGVFRCTQGLLQKYGPTRIIDTPISEQGIVGFGVGLAGQGTTAIAEIQFADYIYPAFDQIVNEVAKYRYRTAGEFDVGLLTIRAPTGAVGHGGMYHSQSPEAYFAHTPGLVVVIPRNAYEAKGLLLASIFNRNPVIFLEPKILYRGSVSEVPEGYYEIPLAKGQIVMEGTDGTIVSWGAQVLLVEKVATDLKKEEGISLEVIDIRTIVPWDRELLIESVKKTGRLIIVHEAPITGGFGAEISATIQSECFNSLKSPVVRNCGFDTPFPQVFEREYLPSYNSIKQTILNSLNYCK